MSILKLKGKDTKILREFVLISLEKVNGKNSHCKNKFKTDRIFHAFDDC